MVTARILVFFCCGVSKLAGMIESPKLRTKRLLFPVLTLSFDLTCNVSCAFTGNAQKEYKQKLKTNLKIEERQANEADLCRNGWLMKNKFTAICIIITETIIFEI